MVRPVKLLLILLQCFYISESSAQFTTGKLKMEAVQIKMNGEDAPPEMTAILGNVSITIYSDGKTQKSVFDMMMMKTSTIIDANKDSIFIYMDMMGNKYCVSYFKGSLNENVNMTSFLDSLNAIQISEHPEDAKEILGFKCHRIDAIVNLPVDSVNGTAVQQKMEMSLYVTNELNFDPSYIAQMNQRFNKIKGTPLEYTMMMGGGPVQMEFHIVAKEFNREINPHDILPPVGEYKKFTMDEFQKEMAGLNR